ncbi:hypothetical protein [Methylobacterium sp. E-046]|uniref:hypothetical protein n=1 Tax=Methylobacterium sp. E-046 TaxID=2836576 RepID=UPI001FBBDF3B|nr:hypothetical protein [Methylobacterium sp. E-046]MCJ2099479.1 hypothetical protein [Methylobacterium sp. E-046]
MRHYHTLLAHENDDAVNEMPRRLITAHADLSTRGRRYNWCYEWRHDHVDVHFRAKADWQHFEETFERKHDAFLRKHNLLEPDSNSMVDHASVDVKLTHQ